MATGTGYRNPEYGHPGFRRRWGGATADTPRDPGIRRRLARRHDFLTHHGSHAAGAAHALAPAMTRTVSVTNPGASQPGIPQPSGYAGVATTGGATGPGATWMPPEPPPHLDEEITLNPSTSISLLWAIARKRPDLRRWLIVNPSSPPELLEYIAQQGGPGVGQGLRVLFNALDILGQHHRAREVMPAMLEADSADLDAALRPRDAPEVVDSTVAENTAVG